MYIAITSDEDISKSIHLGHVMTLCKYMCYNDDGVFMLVFSTTKYRSGILASVTFLCLNIAARVNLGIIQAVCINSHLK